MGLTPSERRIRPSSTGTSVRVQEVGTGEPVLFLHGEISPGSGWAPLVAHLPGVRSLLVDRPGTGLSAPYRITASNLPRIGTAFVADLLDGLGLGAAHVVATSFGGHLALRSAAATPHRILRMVQLGCPAFAENGRVPPLVKVLTWRWARRAATGLPATPLATRVILRQLGHAKSLDHGTLPSGFLDYHLAVQRHTDTMHQDGELIAGRAPAEALVALDDGALARVSAPTLFLWGADDAFGGPGMAQRFLTAMPNADLRVIPDAGHLPWLDDPPGVAETTLSFLTAADVRS